MPSPLNRSAFAPQLRVFRHLDVPALSEDFKETIGKAEGNYEWVDADRARDSGWVEEIMGHTIGAVLVDEHDQFVREYPGPDGFLHADRARASVKVTFDYEVPEETVADESDVPTGFGLGL